jgi:hypothetical protein
MLSNNMLYSVHCARNFFKLWSQYNDHETLGSVEPHAHLRLLRLCLLGNFLRASTVKLYHGVQHVIEGKYQ